MLRAALLVLALLAGGGALAQPAPEAIRWRAVLVAGDPSLPVWDNATRRMAEVIGRQAVAGQVTRLSARREAGATRGGIKQALERIATLRPGPGEGCFVFLTMHGARDAGLVFEPGEHVLTPDSLDAALERGCGAAPTLVIASGCYSGNFAVGRMARPNRVVMTAARAGMDFYYFGPTAGGTAARLRPAFRPATAPGGGRLGHRLPTPSACRQAGLTVPLPGDATRV